MPSKNDFKGTPWAYNRAGRCVTGVEASFYAEAQQAEHGLGPGEVPYDAGVGNDMLAAGYVPESDAAPASQSAPIPPDTVHQGIHDYPPLSYRPRSRGEDPGSGSY